MKHPFAHLAIVGAALLAASAPSHAALTTFSGAGTAADFGGAATARSNFLATVTGSQVLTFEQVPNQPLIIDPAPTGTPATFSDGTDSSAATLFSGTGFQTIISESFDYSGGVDTPPPTPQSLGRFNTTAGGQALLESSGNFSLKFASAIKAFVAFRAAKYEASVKVIRRKLGSAYNAGLKVPWDYWTDQLPWGPETAVPVGASS